nr:stage 0 sporulation family protein [Butyrivibrio sp. AE3006]
MTRVIGVRFRTAGKIYYFDPGDFEIKKGDHVIVETARGIEFGTVLSDPRDVEDEEVTKPLKGVLRMANDKDVEQEATNRIKEKEAFRICKEKIIKHGLEMKLIDAEYTFDNNKVLFYFTADGRIDFRELVKDLASEFKTRIELRQIGVRDETKIIGGYGICGRPLCCHSYLSDFIPVSIKMAKEQNLSLNPTKISGVCGRLMCCLKNEEDVYEELNRKMPGVGDIVASNDGLEGEVASVNILRQTVRILVDVDDEKEVHEYHVDDITFLRKKQKHKQNNAPKEKDVDEEALKALEQEDISGLDDDGNAGAPKANKGDRNRDRKNNDRRDRQNKQNKQGGQNRQNNQNPQDAQNAAGKDNNQNNQNSQNNQPGKGAAEKENAQNNQGAGVEAAEQKGQNDGDNRKKKNRHGGNRKNFNRNGNKGGGKPQGQKGNQDGSTKA